MIRRLIAYAAALGILLALLALAHTAEDRAQAAELENHRAETAHAMDYCEEAEMEQETAQEPSEEEILGAQEKAATEETTSTEGLVDEPMDDDCDSLQYVGEFKITYYCPCSYCCGSNADGITASGTTATAGRTVSADATQLPLGTDIYIDGLGEYTVEDTGSAIVGNILDIYVDSHNEALQLGYTYKDVYIIER